MKVYLVVDTWPMADGGKPWQYAIEPVEVWATQQQAEAARERLQETYVALEVQGWEVKGDAQ
jgi:hypothetical protein